MKQLDYVIEKCASAMNAGIPILYLETDDMSLLDALLRSERLFPYWYKDCDKGWVELDDVARAEHTLPENIEIINGSLSNYFENVNNTNGKNTYMRNSFVATHTDFKYCKTDVRGGVPFVIACRNYQSSIEDKRTPQILERLVSERLSALPGDSILRCFIILQSPVVSLPAGIEPYVEVITVPHLVDDEISEVICDFAKREHEDCPYEHLLESMTLNFRGFTRGKIEQMLRKILLECGTLSDVSVEKVSLKIIGEEKKQMLQKSGLLKSKELSNKEASGLERVKHWVEKREKLFENALEAKRKWAIDAPKGILVTGVPGTGKSLLAEETARILGIPLIQMDMGAIGSKYHGESEQNMRQVIHLAESLAPCVLLIDEIEKAFAGVNGAGEEDGGVARRNFATFLTWMQEKSAPCFIFATANNVSDLPPEFLRRGRFDQKFFTFMPTKKECKSIFKTAIEGKNGIFRHLFEPEIMTDKYLENFLTFCGRNGKFMTGADIQGVVDDAKFLIFSKLSSQNQSDLNIPLYNAQLFRKALEQAVLDARTYGETDMEKIVECLLLLAQNQFAPSSETNVVDISKVNVKKMEMPIYEGETNGYDELLFKRIKTTMEEMKEEKQDEKRKIMNGDYSRL